MKGGTDSVNRDKDDNGVDDFGLVTRVRASGTVA